MKLALVVHPERTTALELAQKVADEAVARGMTLSASADDAERLVGVEAHPASGPEEADVVIAVGGDGTVLEAARLARDWNTPVMGVNAGYVGFLAEVDPNHIPAALDALEGGTYGISTRMTLAATMPDGTHHEALNDVVVEKAVSRQVVRIGVSIEGERLVEYRTDAVIVATPTGSTAYNFSAGGPLVDPEMEALILTAVAPHNLFGRPIVFGPDATLSVQVAAERTAKANIDGQHVADLESGAEIEIARGKRPARLIRLGSQGFAHTVKEKFRLHDA